MCVTLGPWVRQGDPERNSILRFMCDQDAKRDLDDALLNIKVRNASIHVK